MIRSSMITQLSSSTGSLIITYLWWTGNIQLRCWGFYAPSDRIRTPGSIVMIRWYPVIFCKEKSFFLQDLLPEFPFSLFIFPVFSRLWHERIQRFRISVILPVLPFQHAWQFFENVLGIGIKIRPMCSRSRRQGVQVRCGSRAFGTKGSLRKPSR